MARIAASSSSILASPISVVESLRVRDGKAHRHLGEAGGVPLAHHRVEPARPRDVLGIARARADRLDHRRAERIALLASRQRAAREHADADGADARFRGAIEDQSKILRRIGGGQRLARTRIERVVRHLRGVERARRDHAVQRLGLADRREADETCLALLARLVQRRHDVAEHLRDAHRAAVGAVLDHVVQLEHVDMVALQPLRGSPRARPRSRRRCPAARSARAPWSRARCRASGLRARGRCSAPRCRPHRSRRCRTD